MANQEAIRNRMLAVICVVLVAAGLRASYSVTMPLAVALLVIAAIWPAKPWFDRILPSRLSYIATGLLVLVVLGSFLAAVYFSAAQVVGAFAQDWSRIETSYQAVTQWADKWGLSIGGQQGYKPIIGFGQSILSNTYTIFVYLGFIAILVLFGLPEVASMKMKLRSELNSKSRQETIEAVEQVAEKVRAYLGVTTITSLLTGVAATLWALLLGIDLALVWGILNFLLNYIPIFGSLIGIIPPSLYALMQFQTWTTPLIAFGGLSVIQIVIGNFVYPMLQGRSLSLSPFAIIMAMSFWGWVWGVAGALVAVPLTVIFVIACDHFTSTRWIAVLLSEPRPPSHAEEPAGQARASF